MSTSAATPRPPAAPLPLLRRLRPALGTTVEVALLAPESAASLAALEAAFAVIRQAQALWSFQRADSLLSRINSSAGEAVAIDRSTHRLLRLALATMRASAGRFDITVGAALVRRGALPDHGGPPPGAAGEAADIVLGPGSVRLRRPLRLTLDGIAKGYAVDLAVEALQGAGFASGWVNAGGDLRAFGAAAVPVWRRLDDGRLEALGELREAALATSGARLSADEALPALLLGPDRQPTAAGTWSVLARRAWRADALTKVAAATPPTDRHALVARLGGRLMESAA